MNYKMDKKAKDIFKHYKYVIENRKFDEYEILGFLIFIRNFISKDKYKYIYEFTDLVAHRERNKGIVMESIANAIDNKYLCIEGTKKLKGYESISEEDWKEQWIEFGREYGVNLNEIIIKEIVLCIFSLAQKAEYIKDNKKGCIDIMTLINSGSISIITSEIKGESPCVCFSKYNGYKVYINFNGAFDKKILYTIRKNGVLQLCDKDKCILEV